MLHNYVKVLAMKNLAQQIGTKIRAEREAQNLRMRELAAACNMAESQLSKIENGHHVPRLDTFFRLAAGLKMKPCDLLP